jgi:2-polyprenyl-3-methyl-5-hydroxy-6-metoxy-1,4-benzoquinol methylase
MIQQINTDSYWNEKWQRRETGGRYGENQYHFLKDLLPQDEQFTLLDLGCGRGAGVGYLSEVFPKAKIMGFDFAEKAIDIAREKYKSNHNLNFKCGDVYKGDFIFESFDYIIMIELLEHLRWPDKIIEKFKPLTKREMYISIPWNNWECDEHIYAYGDHVNPFEKHNATVLGKIDGRKKLVIKI